MHLYDVATDVLWDRVVPLIVARAGHSVLHPDQWGAVELLVLGGATQIGLEFYRHGIPRVFSSWESLPARGKPLDKLAPQDERCIAFSQVAIVVMTFHYLQFMAMSPNVLWKPEQATVTNTFLALALFFVVYDFFYAPFHRALHHRSVYAYVHKHHHRQVVPTRGNTDAINVHPFEFLMGEYNHVLAIYLVSRFVMPIHAIACVLFLVVGGCLATLNHTRLDCIFLHVPFTNVPIFGVRAHDTHHAIPNTNYGQYIMLWDYVMGTFRPHPLDPNSVESQRTGKAEPEADSGAAAAGAADEQSDATADSPADASTFDHAELSAQRREGEGKCK